MEVETKEVDGEMSKKVEVETLTHLGDSYLDSHVFLHNAGQPAILSWAQVLHKPDKHVSPFLIPNSPSKLVELPIHISYTVLYSRG